MNEKKNIRASVILVSYNSKEDLAKCLPSLLASISDTDEVIIIDNASSDGTVDWLKHTYPHIQLISSSENLGFGGGNNLGAKCALGEFLVFVNPDTLVEPHWIDTLIDALEQDTSIGLATSKIILLNNPNRINTCGNDMHISGITLCRGLNQPRNAYQIQEEVSAISGTAFISRRNLFIKLGGFDESFFMYMEDSDLSLRARLAGYRCIYVPQSIVYHDYKLTIGPLKTYYEERNRYIMLLKCISYHTLLALLPTLFLAEIVTWGFSFLHDQRNLSNKIHAYQWILFHMKEILRSRKLVQAERRVDDHKLLKTTHHRLGYEQTTFGSLSVVTHLIFDPFFLMFKKFALIF